MDLKLVQVKDGIEIPFIWKDNTPGGANLGRAEFVLEVKYLRGKVAWFYVFPAQQRNIKEFWQVSRVSIRDITINSFDGLEPAKVWNIYWCEVHKLPAMSMYVPRESNYLRLDSYGLSFGRK